MVESSGLLNRRRPLKSTGGSNPPLSAIHLINQILAGSTKLEIGALCGRREGIVGETSVKLSKNPILT